MANAGQVYQGVFNGGAANLNPLPYAQEYLGMLAHQNAQRDATRKYLGELGTKLTPTGMVDEDAQALIGKKNEWQNFNIQNQKPIANTNLDGGKAYLHSMNLYNEMQDLIAKSKYKSQMGSYVKQVLDNPAKEAMLTPEAQEAIHRQMLPVTDPNHRSMSAADISFKTAPFGDKDIKMMQPLLPQAQKVYDIKNPIKDPVTGKVVYPYTTELSTDESDGKPNQITQHKVIGQTHYEASPGFKQTIDNISSTDNPLYPTLNEISQKYLGKPLDPLNKSDVATAYTLSLNKSVGQKGTTTPENLPLTLQQQVQKAKEIHQANRQFDLNNPLPNASTNAAKIVDDAIAQAKSDPAKYKQVVTHPDGTKETQWTMPIDQEVRNKLSIKDPATGKLIAPLDIRISDDGTKVTPIFYQGKENPTTGKRGINATFSVPMPRSDFDAVVGDVHKNKAPITNTTTNQKKSKVEKIQGW